MVIPTILVGTEQEALLKFARRIYKIWRFGRNLDIVKPSKMLGEMIWASESPLPRVLGAVWAWVEFLGIELLEMTSKDIESGKRATTVACVWSVLGLLGVVIERRHVRKLQRTFLTNIFSVALDLMVETRLCGNLRAAAVDVF